MMTNPRVKRVLFLSPDPHAADSTVSTVHRVSNVLTRNEKRRRLAPNTDPLTSQAHLVDVQICLLGKRGVALSVSSPSLQKGAVTKDYQLGGTRHEHLPTHLTCDDSVDIIDLATRLGDFEAELQD